MNSFEIIDPHDSVAQMSSSKLLLNIFLDKKNGQSDSCVHIHDWFTLFLAKEANVAIRCNGMRYSRREKINESMKPSCKIEGRIL